MAHTKAAGSTKLVRDSQPQYLGVKLFAGQPANVGSIIVRQRGTKFLPGKNVKLGSDDTIYSMIKGLVHFATRKITNFNGKKRVAKIVNVVPTK